MEADFKGYRADYLVSLILDNGLDYGDSGKGQGQPSITAVLEDEIGNGGGVHGG